MSDILLSLARHDVRAVVTTLLMMDNVPAENISSIWAGLAVDQAVSEELLQILLESITFEKIRQNLAERSSSRLLTRLVMALSVFLESRKLSELVRNRFTEIITKLVLLLSVAEEAEETQLWTLASLRWESLITPVITSHHSGTPSPTWAAWWWRAASPPPPPRWWTQ